MGNKHDYKPGTFLSTLSLRRATSADLKGNFITNISIHALLAESDPAQKCYHGSPAADFYPRSPCGERPSKAHALSVTGSISIHALLAESDLTTVLHWYHMSISIHALLAESDPMAPVC